MRGRRGGRRLRACLLLIGLAASACGARIDKEQLAAGAGAGGGPTATTVPAGGATQWLALFVGERRAREIVLLCDEIPAAQAADWGLVNRAVPAAELDAVVDEWVEKLVRKLPQTTRYAKQQLNWWRDVSWHETVGHARDWLALSMLNDETQDAVRRFLDRPSRESE